MRYFTPASDGRIWQGYDNTLIVAGMDRLIWGGLALEQEDFQILPKHLRAFGDRQQQH